MDRLLQFLLKTFIRRGIFRLTTSRGTQIVFGDGTGKPVAVRFTTRAAEWGILLDPELRLGEAYMDGSFVVEQGSIADVLAVVLGQDRTGIPKWAKTAMVPAVFLSPAATIQPAPALKAKCRAPLRSGRAALFAIPRR